MTLTSAMLPTAPACSSHKPRANVNAGSSAQTLLRSRRCIVSLDIDCFYAQAEELRHPHLRGTPVGVQQKMLVITSNYAARAHGIQKGDIILTINGVEIMAGHTEKQLLHFAEGEVVQLRLLRRQALTRVVSKGLFGETKVEKARSRSTLGKQASTVLQVLCSNLKSIKALIFSFAWLF